MYGIIFVVDSSSVHNICQSYKIFKNLMAHDFLVGKPFLIIANKQDVPGSVDCVDICEYLDIEYLANKYRNPCMIEACGNWTGSINEYDGLEFGISWLVKTISANKQFLINRINFHRIMLEHSSKLFESHRPYTGTRRKSSRFSFRDTRPKTAPPTAMLSENGSYLTRRPSATISTKSGQSQATDLGISEPPNGSNSNTEGLSVVEEELPHNEQLERITMNKNHTETVVVVSNRTHEDLTVEDLSLTLQHVELNKTANGVA
uniref:ADP-ribosylation factor-like protein 13B n=4 Tax=Culex pipiens TaxID=7175 RepID=A0A8D8GML0_CULPI